MLAQVWKYRLKISIDVSEDIVICAASTAAGGSASIQPSTPANKDMLDNVRKCKNFLSTLLKLASNQPATTVQNVKTLIQGLVVGFTIFLSRNFITCFNMWHSCWLLLLVKFFLLFTVNVLTSYTIQYNTLKTYIARLYKNVQGR